MLSESVYTRLNELAGQVAEREGCVLYDIEFLEGRQRTLRVFIDKPGAGVNIQDCSNVSHGLNLLLDVEDLIPGAYNLEVSSPGIERPLRHEWHFRAVIGQTVAVQTRELISHWNQEHADRLKRRKVKATLKDVDNGDLVLNENGLSYRVPITEISKAHLIYDFEG